MGNVFWGIITLAVVAAVAVLIFVMIELRAAIRALKDFLRTSETTLKPTLDELQMTLKSLRNVTDNVTAVTEDVKTLSGSVRNVGESLKHVSELIEGVTSSAVIRASGLRAGINAAVEVLLKGLFSRGKTG